ncbi:hypothetical protein HanRHA438_Chr14g0682511 [Helianthus annuus]|uniref:Uncharacterized protein n=1 Tax=Helianthus annuus TaxID=4232 RepID=A0A251SMG9_HELAN|nr:hypothetical protein HanXRQr2_Chr14g0670601 [Helianthus annuus]KAJ0466284.1 hypothetical protein HanHA300_Chr14g0547391 [Helianthus annuus]KAJ0471296.1 hypothetical protein HanIR_Chr14g0728141 [Helianthus annuus]KAJ0487845.1 hypothetical protein HanHA89_Chr14g0594861 [Helianthus annuus]KAJ0661978.1 hypothetical protein HanOQP8_Chr14g0554411 [Helianthus annuus]
MRRLCDREEQRFKIRIDLMKMRMSPFCFFFRFYLTSFDCAMAGSKENYPVVMCTLEEHKKLQIYNLDQKVGL